MSGFVSVPRGILGFGFRRVREWLNGSGIEFCEVLLGICRGQSMCLDS